MTSPTVPVSWGELLDKTTILQIKAQRLRKPQARANAVKELNLLRRAVAVPAYPGVAELQAALAAVNARLWRTEDLIRQQEAAGDFSPRFVALARAVYHENDERGRIKQAINHLLRSPLVEEKQYSVYQPRSRPPNLPTAPEPRDPCQ